jgi:ankyrin repeat protein
MCKLKELIEKGDIRRAVFTAIDCGVERVIRENAECPECIELAIKYMSRERLQTALRDAVLRGDVQVAGTLLNFLGPDVEVDGEPLLHTAVKKGKIEVLKMLLQRGTDPNKKDKHGKAPLHYAAEFCCIKCVKLLLEAGADPRLPSKRGRTPLNYAAAGGCAEVFEMLLKYEEPSKKTLKLTTERSWRYGDRRRILFSIVERLKSSGETLSDVLSCELLKAAVEVNDREVVELYVREGVRPEKCGECIASRAKSPEVFRLLAEGSCIVFKRIENREVLREAVKIFGPNYIDRRGDTPLHAAARLCDVELLQQLLEAGVKPVENSYGLTPLDYAARAGCAEGVSLLIKHVQPSYLTVRAALPHPEALSVIASTYPKIIADNVEDLMWIAVMREYADSLSIILSTVNVDEKTRTNLLFKAAQYCKPRAVRVLGAANPNVRDELGSTPLHYAACRGVVEALVELGADVNARDWHNNTPLHDAVSDNRPSVVEALLERGADPNIQNGNGDTPLHIAARLGYTRCVEALLKYGARKDIKNNEGKTPADLAWRKSVYKMLSTANTP